MKAVISIEGSAERVWQFCVECSIALASGNGKSAGSMSESGASHVRHTGRFIARNAGHH